MLDDSQFDCTIKLLVLGGSSVGKSNFIHRFITNKFSENHISSSGLELKSSEITIKNKRIRVQLWDTAGQEKYKSLTKSLFVKVQGIIAMFDLTNEDSFNQAKFWIKSIREECGSRMPLILLGNKSDLEEQREVSKEEGQQKAELYKLAFMETSALNGNNIEKAFTELVNDVYKNHHNSIENDAKIDLNDKGVDLNDAKENNEEKKKCCGSS